MITSVVYISLITPNIIVFFSISSQMYTKSAKLNVFMSIVLKKALLLLLLLCVCVCV